MKKIVKQKTKPGQASLPKKNVSKAKPALKPTGKKNSNKKWAQLNLDQFINSSDEDESRKEKDVKENEENNSSIEHGSSDDEMEGDFGEEEQVSESDDSDLDMDQEEDSDLDEEADSDDNEDDGAAAKKHKKSLSKLKETDPEFYKFLSENDRALLEFNTSDSEDEEKGGKVHKLPNPEDLAVGSDESDEEDAENIKRKSNVVTMRMVKKWQSELKQEK